MAFWTRSLGGASVQAAPNSLFKRYLRQYGFAGALRAMAFGRPKVKALRPAGHSATIEALRNPMIWLGSSVLAAAATYVLAKPSIVQAGRSLAARDWAASLPAVILVAVVFFTGVIIDYTFVTAAIRFAMHLQRGWHSEKVYILMAVFTMLLLGGVEGSTLARMMYESNPSDAVGWTVTYVQQVPHWLFLVRAFGVVYCLFYQIVFVLPLRTSRRDLTHAVGSQSSGQALALGQDLSLMPEVDDPVVKVSAFEAQLALARWANREERGGKDTAETERQTQADRELTEALRAFQSTLGAHRARIVEADPSPLVRELPAASDEQRMLTSIGNSQQPVPVAQVIGQTNGSEVPAPRPFAGSDSSHSDRLPRA